MGRQELAKAIIDLTYGEMMEIANEFNAMVKDEEAKRSLDCPADYASMFHDWADAQ